MGDWRAARLGLGWPAHRSDREESACRVAAPERNEVWTPNIWTGCPGRGRDDAALLPDVLARRTTCPGGQRYAAATAGSRRGISTSRAITSRWICDVPS